MVRKVLPSAAVLLVPVFLLCAETANRAQSAAPAHTLTFAELTYGTAIRAMAPDGQGGAWFGGSTCSTSLPTTPNAVERTMTSGCHGFVGRMTADGAITYLSYLGGTQGGETVFALAVDAAGNVYAGGSTYSPDFPTTAGAYDRVCGNDGTCTIDRFSAQRFQTLPASDGFVTEISPDGSRILYSTFIGGSYDDAVTGVAVDRAGQIHVTGRTNGDFPVTAGALQTAWSPDFDPDENPLDDGFYARIGADRATLAYGTYLGGSGSDQGAAVAVDTNGDAYVTGTTRATNFPVLNAARPVNIGPSRPDNQTTPDGFLARFNAAGAVYSTYVGGSAADEANAIAINGGSVFLAGSACSTDFPGVSDPNVSQCAAYVATLGSDSGAVQRTVTLHNTGGWDRALALAVDSGLHAYVSGLTVTNANQTPGFPTTPDAYESTVPVSGSNTGDAFLSIVDLSTQSPALLYSTYLGGGNEEQGYAVAPDGAGGAFFGGYSRVFPGYTSSFPSHTSQPQPPADSSDGSQSFAAHVATAQSTTGGPAADVVLYARDAVPVAGNWQFVADTTAAGGTRIWNPDAGVPKIGTPAVSPANYFELTFNAQAGVPYHLWLRMKADNDSYQNDSVFVQFSDTVDGSGNPIWRTGTNGATVVSLEDCGGCGEHGWGWNDNGYNTAGQLVTFATTGAHTIRIQQREDGVSIDQIVLSSRTWLNAAPGANRDDTTIVPRGGTSNQPPIVSITSPADGATYTDPADINLAAAATDNDGSVAKVDFYLNATLFGSQPPTSPSGPFTLSLTNVLAGTYRITAVATDNSGATTTSNAVTVTVRPAPSDTLPQGWSDSDVGDVGLSGHAAFDGGTGQFTVQGAGADVWGTADAFNYAYVALPTNGWIRARVASVSSEASWVKAGVMIRSSLSPSAAQAFMIVSHAKGVAFQRRIADGATTVSTPGSASTAPQWVMLVRQGSVITGYESPDGANWTFVGSDVFTMPDTVLMGLAVSSHIAGTLAMGTFDNVKTQALPNGWADVDIGAVPFAGNANWDAGTFTVTGSGADIWGTADAFTYTYHLLNGDGTIVARVASVENAAPWTKAGLMIRNTFDPGSAHATVLVSAGRGVAFQRRPVAGGTSVSTAGSASTAPRWLKLTRSGGTFTAYESPDGTAWTQIGSDTIPMEQTIYVGLAVASHSATSSATSVFDNVSIQ